MDIDALIKEVAAKMTIEDSVDVLLITIGDSIIEHPDDQQRNLQLANLIIARRTELAAAVVDNIK